MFKKLIFKNKTPSSMMIHESKINKYCAKRIKTEYGGCFMCHGLFVKSDKKLGCSCMIGYYANLGDIGEIDVGEFISSPLITYIKESFHEGYEPFDMCSKCVSRTAEYPEEDDNQNITLHIEPSNNCNLYCSACTCTVERASDNTPPRVNLSYQSYEKMINELKQANININRLAFVGFGEPLFNSEIPKMVSFAREVYPEAYIFIDTNANFASKRAIEIANCGFSEIRIGLDGSDQDSYEAYRKNGNFDKAFNFTRTLSEEVRRTGSTTKIIWKYILFKNNDTDTHIESAIQYAEEIGVELQFDYTVGKLASTRTKDDIESMIGKRRIGFNLDPKAYYKMSGKLKDIT
jgi:uncharacterized radical SAM superfamily Fe-S cluster-containing enzyme